RTAPNAQRHLVAALLLERRLRRLDRILALADQQRRQPRQRRLELQRAGHLRFGGQGRLHRTQRVLARRHDQGVLAHGEVQRPVAAQLLSLFIAPPTRAVALPPPPLAHAQRDRLLPPPGQLVAPLPPRPLVFAPVLDGHAGAQGVFPGFARAAQVERPAGRATL